MRYASWSKTRLINRIIELEALIGKQEVDPIKAIASTLSIPIAQAKIIAELSTGEVVSRPHLFLTVYKDVINQPTQRAIDNHINRIRDRLEIFGVVLNSSHGAGVQIENPELIKAVMAGNSTASWFPNGLPIVGKSGEKRDKLVKEAVLRRLEVSEPARIESREIRVECGITGSVSGVMDRLHRKGVFRVVRRPTQGQRQRAWVIRRSEG